MGFVIFWPSSETSKLRFYRIKSEQNPKESLNYYRILQILCSRNSESYSGCFIPHITIFVCENLILGIYGTVKFYDQLDAEKYMNFPLMTSMMIILLFSLYPKNASVFETAKYETKETLKRGLKGFPGSVRKLASAVEIIETAEEPRSSMMKEISRNKHQLQEQSDPVFHTRPGLAALKEIKCIARSCPAIGIPFGSLYMTKRSTVLNLFNFIACNTISTLITYP